MGRGGLEPPEPVKARVLQTRPLPITVYLPNFVSPREHESNMLSPFAHVLTVMVFIGFFRPPCHSLALTLSLVNPT